LISGEGFASTQMLSNIFFISANPSWWSYLKTFHLAFTESAIDIYETIPHAFSPNICNVGGAALLSMLGKTSVIKLSKLMNFSCIPIDPHSNYTFKQNIRIMRTSATFSIY